MLHTSVDTGQKSITTHKDIALTDQMVSGVDYSILRIAKQALQRAQCRVSCAEHPKRYIARSTLLLYVAAWMVTCTRKDPLSDLSAIPGVEIIFRCNLAR